MKVLKIAGVAFALAIAAGCRTTKAVLDDYEKALSSGQYEQPIAETVELAEKGDDSILLWQLLSGAAYYMADNKPGARRMFDAAEDTFAKNDQTSVFAQGGQGDRQGRGVGAAGEGDQRRFPPQEGGAGRQPGARDPERGVVHEQNGMKSALSCLNLIA